MTSVVCLLVLAGPVAAQVPRPVAVPFTVLPSRHIAIEAKVNGKGPYPFVFDTGAPFNLVADAVAKDAGLAGGGLGGLGMLVGRPRQAKVEVVVGDATAKDVPVLVLDHPTVAAISDAAKLGDKPLRGIVGFPFFARYAVTVDYQAKQLTLTANGYQPNPDPLDVLVKRMSRAAEASAPKVVAPGGLWGLVADRPAGDTAAGVTLTRVEAGGPADKAGLRAGDRLLTVDGRWADTVLDLTAAAGFVNAGQPVEVVFVRAGVERKCTVTPAKGL